MLDNLAFLGVARMARNSRSAEMQEQKERNRKAKWRACSSFKEVRAVKEEVEGLYICIK